MVVVQRGLNPRKTLVGFGSLTSEKRLAAGDRRERVKRCEERERERRLLAVPPIGVWFLVLHFTVSFNFLQLLAFLIYVN